MAKTLTQRHFNKIQPTWCVAKGLFDGHIAGLSARRLVTLPRSSPESSSMLIVARPAYPRW
jgi:hypothetical protein